MAKPVSGAISTENKARNATVVATSGNATLSLYPAANLTDPERTRRWRTAWSDTTSDTARVVMDLGSDTSPGIFSLIDCNASSGRVRLYGADDSSLTTNVIYYDFDLYDAGDSGAHVFYPQADSVRFATSDDVSRYSFATASLSTTNRDWPATASTIGDLGRLFGRTAWGARLAPSGVKRGNWYGSDGNFARGAYWLEDDGSGTQYQTNVTRGSETGVVNPMPPLPMGWITRGNEANHGITPAESVTLAGENGAAFGFITSDAHTPNIGSERLRSWLRHSGNATGGTNQIVTVACRVYSSSTSDQFHLWGHGDYAANDTGVFYKRSTEKFIVVADSSDDGGATDRAEFSYAASNFVNDEWHVVTLVCYSSTVQLWVDGVSLGDAVSIPSGFDDPMYPYSIGRSRPENSGDYSGKMDTAYLANATNTYTYQTATTAGWVAASNAEAMHLVGISTDNLKRRYWAIDFDGVTKLGTTSHLEVGAVWLGDRRDIEVQAGASVNLSDPSQVAQSYGGTVYLDRQTPFRTANVSVEQLTLANAYALQSELSTAGGREVVVDLHSSSSDATLRDSGAIYGRAGGSPASATLSSGSGSTVSLQITESRK